MLLDRSLLKNDIFRQNFSYASNFAGQEAKKSFLSSIVIAISAVFLLFPVFFIKKEFFIGLIGIFLLLSPNSCKILPLALFAFIPFYSKQILDFLHLQPPFILFFNLLLPLLLLLPFYRQFFQEINFRLFRLSSVCFKQIILILFFSCLALAVWRLMHPDIIFPKIPPFLISWLPLLALFNAFIEETVFRGVMQNTFFKLSSSVQLANILQAVWFAALHFSKGFPCGVSGFFLTFLYAAALGHIRLSSHSLGWCILMHFAADLTIANLLVFI